MISNVINQIARQTIGKDWLLYAALLDHWSEIVGQEYAGITTPVKITFPHQPNEARRKNGTLSVKIPKGLAMEFSFKAEPIKQRINSYFGYDAITRIVFDSIHPTSNQKAYMPPPITSEAQKTAADTVKELPAGELRDALQSFGQTVLSVKSSAAKNQVD